MGRRKANLILSGRGGECEKGKSAKGERHRAVITVRGKKKKESKCENERGRREGEYESKCADSGSSFGRLCTY